MKNPKVKKRAKQKIKSDAKVNCMWKGGKYDPKTGRCSPPDHVIKDSKNGY